MEIHAKKNQALEVMFPMVDSTTPASLKTGETVADTAFYKDGAGAWTSLAITDDATEISTSGMYTIEMTAAEVNHDLIMIKFTSTNTADSVVVIRTFDVDVEDLVRSTTPANTLTVDANNRAEVLLGAVTHTGATIPTISTLTGHTAQSADHAAAITTIDTVVDAIKLITDAIPNSGALTDIDTGVNNLETRVPNTISLAAINAEVDTALNTTIPASPTGDSINDVLNKQRLAIVSSTCAAGSTQTVVESNLTQDTNDHYNGRIIVFTGGALLGQASSISDYNGTSKQLTVVTLTEAPANTDPFLIV